MICVNINQYYIGAEKLYWVLLKIIIYKLLFCGCVCRPALREAARCGNALISGNYWIYTASVFQRDQNVLLLLLPQFPAISVGLITPQGHRAAR